MSSSNRKNRLTDYQQRRLENEEKQKGYLFFKNRFIIIGVVAAIVLLLWLWAIGFNNFFTFVSTNHATVIAGIGTVIGIVISAWPEIRHLYEKSSLENKIIEDTAVMELGIQVIHEETVTTLKCTIKNIGNVHFEPFRTAVFVDQAKYNPQKKLYEFPFIQEKGRDAKQDQNLDDCTLSYRCQRDRDDQPFQISYPIDEPVVRAFYEENKPGANFLFHECYCLKHLSRKSLFYIGSQETMEEDLLLKLSPGYYRAIMVVVSKGENCDCKCITTSFEVPMGKSVSENEKIK